jgi:ADP-ribose pyrophosphatase YjhB (NUDIX family)
VRELHIAAAVVRRGSDILMVQQAGPGEEPAWTVPGGRVEPGEFVTDALAREVQEETGVAVLDPARLAFTAQVDERRDGWFATVWTWDVAAWEGELEVQDPDGYVTEAQSITLEEAVSHLEQISWQPLTARYLRGDLEPGSLWLRRVHEDGREEWLGSYGSGSAP